MHIVYQLDHLVGAKLQLVGVDDNRVPYIAGRIIILSFLAYDLGFMLDLSFGGRAILSPFCRVAEIYGLHLLGRIPDAIIHFCSKTDQDAVDKLRVGVFQILEITSKTKCQLLAVLLDAEEVSG